MFIKVVEDVSVNVFGGVGGGGSLIDDLLDFGGDKKSKKCGKYRGKLSKFSRLKNVFKFSCLFGGGVKVVGVLGVGSFVVGGLDIVLSVS